MPKHRPDEVDLEGDSHEKDASAIADSLVERGRAALAGVPGGADRARQAVSDAQGQLNGLSDVGVVAAAGFALGVTCGLFLAGAPRLILAISAIPVALTLQSTMARGLRPVRLVN